MVLLSLHKCDKITCIYWCFTPLCLCRHLEIPRAPTTSGDYSARINFKFRGLNLRRSTTILRAPHTPTYIIEIDNDERGVIGDFTTISDIRITKAKPE